MHLLNFTTNYSNTHLVQISCSSFSSPPPFQVHIPGVILFPLIRPTHVVLLHKYLAIILKWTDQVDSTMSMWFVKFVLISHRNNHSTIHETYLKTQTVELNVSNDSNQNWKSRHELEQASKIAWSSIWRFARWSYLRNTALFRLKRCYILWAFIKKD